MSLDYKVSNGVLYVGISGRFDSSERVKFREMNKLVEKDIQQVEFDLAGVNFISSSALGMLLVMRDKLVGEKSAFKIKNANNSIKNTLEIVKFDDIFELL